MSRILSALAALLVAVAVLPILPAAAVGERLVIDFEGLAEGAIVDSVAVGSGVSGTPVPGSIGVRGWREGARDTQRAMIFDGTCAPWNTAFGCSGQDYDLFFPSRGNLLIVSEDLDSSDPDDDTNGGFTLDFSGIGPVTVESVAVLDTNGQTARITFSLTDGTSVVRSVAGTGDGRGVDVRLGVGAVTSMEVDLDGAGAVDDIVLVLEETPTTTTTTVPATTTTTTVPATTTTTTVPATTTTTTAVPVPGTSDGLVMRVLVDGVVVSGLPGPTVTAGASGRVTYEVTNTSTSTAWALYIWQEGFGGATCPVRTVRAGETVTCELRVTFGAGSFARVAEATAWPESGTVSATTTLAYTTDPASTTTTTVPATTTTTTTTVPATTTTTTVPPGPTGGLVNVALGKRATQANTNNWLVGTPPERAVDGNRDGDHESGSVAMTYRVSDAWWEVDLGSVYEIDHITLWNRTDCCADRLRDFYVFVSDEPFEVKDIKNTLTQAGVAAHLHPGAAGRSTEVQIGRSGRYVRVQLDYLDAVLQLAEVEVMVDATRLTVDARVAGEAADSAPGPVIAPGNPIPMTFDVTNTGVEVLYSLSVRVDGFGSAICPDRRIDPGASVTCTLSTVAVQGLYSATARATAYDASGDEITDSDPIHVFVPASTAPAIKLDVLVDGLNGDRAAGPRIAAGETMTFSYLVSNEGPSVVTDIALRDTAHGSISCPRTMVNPGETLVCIVREVATNRVTFFDATVTGRAGSRNLSDTERLYYHVRDLGRLEDLRLEVTINGVDADAPPGPVLEAGRTARIRYVVTNNSSQTTVWSVEILDPRVPANRIACSGGPNLAPFQSMICNATIVTTVGDWSNLVVARGWGNNGPRLDASDRVHYKGIA